MEYTKQYSNPAQLVELLKERGLEIANDNEAESFIRAVGYYRLSAYLYPFLSIPKQAHIFKSGSQFGKVMTIYEFDRQLRFLIFDQIERIEIAVRSAMVNITCNELNDPFWMTNSTYFANADKFQRTKQLIDKELTTSREDFIEHFKSVYSSPYPPAWMLAEIMPFGVLTRVYENIASNRIRKKIAQYFGLNVPVLSSWLTIVTLTRNSCCHHARMWNRNLSLRALTMQRWDSPWVSPKVAQGRIFFTLCILKHFIDTVKPDNTFKKDLQNLLSAFPMVDTRAMGFPDGWEREPLWRE